MSNPVSVTCYIPGPNNMVLGVSRRGRPTEFGLPGGKVDPGETFEQAVIRELKEETGLTLTSPVLIYSDMCPGETTYRNHVFKGDISGEIVPEEGLVVKMVTWATLFAGPFGEYNKRFHLSITGKHCLNAGKGCIMWGFGGVKQCECSCDICMARFRIHG